MSWLLLMILLLSGCTSSYPRLLLDRPYAGAIEVIRSGDADKVLLELESTAHRFDAKGEKLNALQAYRSAALLAEAVGNYQKMLTYAKRSYDLAYLDESGRDRDSSSRMVSQLLAKSHLAVNDHDSVIPLLLKVLPRRVPSHRKGVQHYAELHGTLGDTYQRNGDLKSALRHHEEAFRAQGRVWNGATAAKRMSEKTNRSRAPVHDRLLRLMTSLTRDHIALGAYRRAADYGNRLLSLAMELDYPHWEGEAHRLRGDIALKQGRHDIATTNYQRLLSMEEDSVNPSVRLWSHVGLARVRLAVSQPDLAAKDFERAMDIVETLRTFLETEDVRSSFFEDKAQIYADAALVQLKLGRIDDAFHTAERARARAFLDLLGTWAGLSKNQELVAAEMNFQRKIAELRLAIAEDDETEEADERHEEIQALQKDYHQFLAKVSRESGEQSSLVTVQPLRLRQVQELLEPEQTLLEYFVTAEKTYLWTVTREHSQMTIMDVTRKELSAKLNALRQAIAEIEPVEKYREVAGDLYRRLVAPARPFIRGKEIVIVPHDVLHYLPFQALNDSDGRYLVEDYGLHYLSSASLLKFTKEKNAALTRTTPGFARQMEKVLALGNPDLGNSRKSLQYAGIEAREIKALYPQATIYVETEATEDNAKRWSPLNDVLHFASHAELNENDPLSSAVLLAKSDKEDGRLEVREIFGMDIKANLVVLSACETGLGKLSSGDELVGLTRAFIYAGTPSVVASLWNVEDSSTAQLMASSYKNLKTMTKVEALRQAQLQLIRGNVNSDLLARRGIGGVGKLGETPAAKAPGQGPAGMSISTSHPYFWAPFILVGDGK